MSGGYHHGELLRIYREVDERRAAAAGEQLPAADPVPPPAPSRPAPTAAARAGYEAIRREVIARNAAAVTAAALRTRLAIGARGDGG